MTCGYCGSRNGEGEHRCRRCGRTADDSLTGEFTLPRTAGALAAKLQPAAQDDPPKRDPDRKPGVERVMQGSLFQDRPASNVIPFDSFTPLPGAPPKPRPKAASDSQPGSKPLARRTPRVPEGQGKLDLLPAIPVKPRTLGTTVEAVICCEASVAIPLHRALAAAIDWILVLIGYGLLLGAFWLGGGAFVLTKPNLLVFGGALLLVGFTYGLWFALAGTETAGMRCAPWWACCGAWPTKKVSLGRTTFPAPFRRPANGTRRFSAGGKNEHPLRREEPAGRYGRQSQRPQPFRNRAFQREGSQGPEIFPPAKR